MASETLILRDGDGTYYQLDRAVLEAGRVPEARVAELEGVLGGEVAGFGMTTAAGLSRLEIVGAIGGHGLQHSDAVHADILHVDVTHADRPT